MTGDNYEALLDKERRKEIGAFYTPEVIIDFMLDKSVAQADLLTDPYPRIIDPACGCGYFLLRTYDLLYKMFSMQLDSLRQRYAQQTYRQVIDGQDRCMSGQEYWQLEHLPYHIISQCLFGADLDEQAVAIASAALAQKAGITAFSPNLIVGDSLAKADNTLVRDQEEMPASRFWSQSYNYVIGNPPYVSYGLRGAKAIDRQRYNELAAAYPGSAEYKLSLYALFFERGVELLAPGGKLAYITPDSFLSGRYFSKLRSFLSQYAINSITLLEFTVFPDAAIGKGVITVLTNNANIENKVCVEAAANASQLKSGQFVKRFTYDQQYLDRRFSLFFDKEEFEVFHAMQAFAKRFSDCGCIYSGCIARYGQKSIVVHEPAADHIIYDYQGNIVINDRQAETRWKKLIGRGAYINQYFIKPECQYIYIHEDEAVRRTYAKSGFDLDKYAKEKLFIRQTGETLIAAYDSSGYYCLNNMHILYSIDDDIPVKLLLALINSRLYNYYYQCITRETGRVLPQVDIDTLRGIPVVTIPRKQQVVALVDELLTCYGYINQAKVSAGQNRLREIRHALELAVLDNVDIKPSARRKILQN